MIIKIIPSHLAEPQCWKVFQKHIKSGIATTQYHLQGGHGQVNYQVQPKPQLSWVKWLYFQLIQPPHPHRGKFILQQEPATQKLMGS